MSFRPIAACAALLTVLWAGVVAAETRLVMFEEPGCVYCAQWKAEVGDAYHLTAEGRAAPLRTIFMADPLPDGLTLERPVVYSPTFVLSIDGAEVARLEGYPGEDFFWGLLGAMLTQNGVEWATGNADG